MTMSTGHCFEGNPTERAGGATGSTVPTQGTDPGSNPRPALRALLVKPIPPTVAKELLVWEHYLGSYPGGTHLALGVFLVPRLLGVLTLGAGPAQVHALAEGARPQDCLALTRLWLSHELPPNSESRVLWIVLRSLRSSTGVKFVISYADPAQGHLGYIYQATNWLYTGLSQATPLYDIGDGKLYHSRTLSQIYGTHSLKYLRNHGVQARLVPQEPKHRYIYFLDRSWRARLKVPVLPYPKPSNETGEIEEVSHGIH